MTSSFDVDIMMIGHFAKDKLVVDDQSDEALGGAVYYGGIAMRRLGVSVAVVTRLHPDDFPFLDEFKRAGVQVFATPAPQTSGIKNVYNSADMERRVCTPLGFAGLFQPEEVPDLSARLIVVAPIMVGEVDLALLKSLAARGPVALDVQGFVRVREGDRLIFRHWPEMKEGLSHITYLKVDRAEAELLTSRTDLRRAVQQLADFGPREIIATQSSGVTVFVEDVLYQFPFSPRSLIGRTGRGDTCFATYLATRLSASPEEAGRVAAAITTLKQEQPGPWSGNWAAVEALLAESASTE